MFPLIKFFNFQIPTFFLVISLSLTGLLFWLSARLESKSNLSLALNSDSDSDSDSEKKINFDRKIAFDLALLLMISGFWGARLFHVFYEQWPFYSEYPSEIFKFWKGGFVYFGGFFSAGFFAFIYLFIKKQNFLNWADFITPLLSASYALGRVGCFFEGCCYGRFCNLPWAIDGRHPTQLYMIFGEFFILGLLLFIEKQKTFFRGFLFLIWLFLHSVFRFIFEYFRDDDRGSFLLGLSISQWMSLGLVIGLMLTAVFYFSKKQKHINK